MPERTTTASLPQSFPLQKSIPATEVMVSIELSNTPREQHTHHHERVQPTPDDLRL